MWWDQVLKVIYAHFGRKHQICQKAFAAETQWAGVSGGGDKLAGRSQVHGTDICYLATACSEKPHRMGRRYKKRPGFAREMFYYLSSCKCQGKVQQCTGVLRGFPWDPIYGPFLWLERPVDAGGCCCLVTEVVHTDSKPSGVFYCWW